LGARVEQVQLRRMRSKWGSVSTRGTLTLADDLLHLPSRLVAYVFCHELLHRQVPKHNATYRLLLTRYLPDWREREGDLGQWVLALDQNRSHPG
jgi:predicted metal-dependent hydrolase